MELKDVIFKRRSIRKYSEGIISKKEIEEIIKAGMYAPSARNFQSWHFLVTESNEDLAALSEIHPYGKMLKNAAAAILVCGDLNIEPSPEYNAINCSAAIQNMLLIIHDMNLGAVWLGVFPREERTIALKEFYNLPQYILPIGLISIGYPAEEPAFPDRFKPERIRYGKWGE
ncbi:MAG: nitroreductase family protein [Bacteroidales bacterium]|nr:nitroreductase family protein [Bacteroidales bacterium]